MCDNTCVKAVLAGEASTKESNCIKDVLDDWSGVVVVVVVVEFVGRVTSVCKGEKLLCVLFLEFIFYDHAFSNVG